MLFYDWIEISTDKTNLIKLLELLNMLEFYNMR